MKAFIKKNTAYLYSTLLYTCSFFLFLEWIYPLEDVSDTTNISVFVIYTLYCYILSFLPIRWWMSAILKGLGLLFLIHFLYLDHYVIFSLAWVQTIILEISFNIRAIFSQDWYYLTPLFRTILFFLLIWLMSYLHYYWFVELKRIFLFILLTFIYITVLDTFTTYDAGVSIVRAFIFALIALAISNAHREFSHISVDWLKGLRALLLPLVGIILFSTIIGLIFPKVEPQWPDPVPFLYSAAGGDGGAFEQIKKVGYGEDDSRLGGSFVQDNTPVFTSYVYDRHYWRIETKDVYTGKGWELGEKQNYQQQADGNIQLRTFSNLVASEDLTAVIDMHNFSIGKLIYPYGIYQAKDISNETTIFALDHYSEAIQTEVPHRYESLIYEMNYYHPSYDIHKLKSYESEDPREILEIYTQLPSTLPERIRDLAAEITDETTNRYDAVKEIEHYFGRNGFEYETANVPVPAEDEDYVDQFLFETQRGYCDNFSTAMVVMLRTLDIPARWVKGFTSGERIENNFGIEPDVYQVTNSNAHSWVEVYFPETGWVPFEPTQGFINPAEFYYGETESVNIEQSERRNNVEDQEEAEEVETKEDNTDKAFQYRQFNMKDSWGILFSILILFISGFILYKLRYRILAKHYVVKITRNLDAKNFQDAYHFLIRLLRYKGYSKLTGETLREYASKIDKKFDTIEMRKLTDFYERVIYKNEFNERQSSEVIQLWKNFVNRIMG